ncbi:MAG: hypothetical protein IKO45_04955 [Clostridia bacterium]|nr:hypothetical protein [Clostridia bacterium]MBR4623883.1 hypothetical protein [Clostridia bacterium]
MAEKKQWEINKIARNMEYNKENYRRVMVAFHMIHDVEMLNWIESKPNKQGYIKSLIQADINKHNAELIKK